MVGEITPAGLTALLERFPAVASVFELVRLAPLTDGECDRLAQELTTRVEKATGIGIGADVTDTVMQLARHYLGSGLMPGAALDLLKSTAQRVLAHGGTRMDRGDIVATLSKLTGMPSLVLDDRERVNLAEVRAFFTSRVIGQDEAVGPSWIAWRCSRPASPIRRGRSVCSCLRARPAPARPSWPRRWPSSSSAHPTG